MQCAFCKSDIENDSFHCDQCGKEIFLCPNCNLPRKGKHCVEDTGKLYSPKQKANANITTSQPISINPTPQNNSILKNISQSVSPSNSQNPILKIVNTHLKIDIEIKNGDIIGRTEGNYSNLFNQFSQISGKHVQFNFDNVNGWQIKDFGSTNGSAISDNPNWQTVPKLKQDIPVQVKNNSLLLIANIEFQVKIILPQTSTGTQRL